MKPYYEQDGIVIYHGDCREIAPRLESSCAIVADPPYGMAWDTDGKRFSGGAKTRRPDWSRGRDWGGPVKGDAEPFDPTPWLAYPEAILWGANHYAQRLPVGTTLVWIKRFDSAFGTFLSDAEIAWQKGGYGVYCRRETSLSNHNGDERWHPTQKPLSLMVWCIGRTAADVVLDPFMGSGTTLVAAKQLGRKAIGIEIEERYCFVAAQRLAQGVLDLHDRKEGASAPLCRWDCKPRHAGKRK